MVRDGVEGCAREWRPDASTPTHAYTPIRTYTYVHIHIRAHKPIHANPNADPDPIPRPVPKITKMQKCFQNGARWGWGTCARMATSVSVYLYVFMLVIHDIHTNRSCSTRSSRSCSRRLSFFCLSAVVSVVFSTCFFRQVRFARRFGLATVFSGLSGRTLHLVLSFFCVGVISFGEDVLLK